MTKLKICVKEVKGNCAMNYQPGGCFTLEKFYIKDAGKGICIHALAAMLTFLTPLLKGISPKTLGIGKEDKGYVQCPDPGRPHTCGGTVTFQLRRETPEQITTPTTSVNT